MTLGGVFLGLAGCAEAPKEKLPLATLDELQKEDGVLRFSLGAAPNVKAPYVRNKQSWNLCQGNDD